MKRSLVIQASGGVSIRVRIRCVFLISLIAGGLLWAPAGFSKEQRTGFYAGPLSDTLENIKKKADLKKIRESSPAEETIIAAKSPIVKKEKFNFQKWLRKAFGLK